MAVRRRSGYKAPPRGAIEEMVAGFFAAMDAVDAIELMSEIEQTTEAFDETDETSTRALIESELNIEDLDEVQDEVKTP
jgi:hypothetical protein